MKKGKEKSPTEGEISYQKPALRSEAFARALREAKLRVVGVGGLRSLFEKAAKEAALSADDAATGPRLRAGRIPAGFE